MVDDAIKTFSPAYLTTSVAGPIVEVDAPAERQDKIVMPEVPSANAAAVGKVDIVAVGPAKDAQRDLRQSRDPFGAVGTGHGAVAFR
jgi:hypothetical protein